MSIFDSKTHFFMKWSMTSKVIQAHLGPLLCQNLCSTFVYGPILIKICMNDNIMKTQFFHEMSPLCCWEVLVFFFLKNFWLNYNLDLPSYGQLLSFFFCIIKVLLTDILKMYFGISDLDINKYTGCLCSRKKKVFHIH